MEAAKSAKSMIDRVKIDDRVEELGSQVDIARTFEIESFLPDACAKLQCEVDVIVFKEYQRDDFLDSLKNKASSKKIVRITEDEGPQVVDSAIAKTEKEESSTSFALTGGKTVIVNAIYDAMDRLIEISLTKMRFIPRILVQLIGHSCMYCPKLTKVTMKNCCIDVYTVFELKKLLPISMITDICLDYSPLLEANFGILLDEATSLKYLSLVGCHINDEVCKRIVTKLKYTCPAEGNLALLNLSCNLITDVGAEYIGEILRTNRHLRYLNLSSNRITDKGTLHILNALCEFILTEEEVYDKRSRFIKYFKEKMVISKYNAENDDPSTTSKGKSAKDAKGKRNSVISMKKKTVSRGRLSDTGTAPTMNLVDPFSPFYTTFKNKALHCAGNMTLCYLDLSYNKLSYLILKKFKDVLLYQILAKRQEQTGLIKIVLEGNHLPESCQELQTVNDLLTRLAIARARAFADMGSKRKSLVKTPR